jgi:hypothetical protein
MLRCRIQHLHVSLQRRNPVCTCFVTSVHIFNAPLTHATISNLLVYLHTHFYRLSRSYGSSAASQLRQDSSEARETERLHGR